MADGFVSRSVLGLDRCCPAGFDDGRRQRIDDDRRTRNAAAGGKRAALMEGIMQGPPASQAVTVSAATSASGAGAGRPRARRPLRSPDTDAIDDQIVVRRIAEACAEGIGSGGTHRQSLVGSSIALVAVGETHEQQGFVRDRCCQVQDRRAPERRVRPPRGSGSTQPAPSGSASVRSRIADGRARPMP